MRITADLILQSRAFYNPLKERELDLRGLKIPTIENLGATEDQFDTIDFTDNSITVIENIPHFDHLKALIFTNSRVATINEAVCANIPNLETLIYIFYETRSK